MSGSEYYQNNKEKYIKYAEANKQQIADYKRFWNEKNKERIREKFKNRPDSARERKAKYDKEYNMVNAERIRENKRKYAIRLETRALKNEANRRRRMYLKQATPNWMDEFDELFIKEIYHLASLRSEILGIKHHVDHIIPLKGKTVCGLHVPLNLRILTAEDNIRKNNKFEEN